MHSNNPPKLYYLIKVNAVLCALYFGFRAAVLLDYCTDTPAAAIAAVFVVCALAGFYLSVNIWSRKGKTKATDCRNCPFISQCTHSKNHTKVIHRHLWEKYLFQRPEQP